MSVAPVLSMSERKAGLSKFECGMVVGTNNSCTTVSEYFRNCWYFPTQPSLEFTENFLKNRKDPMSSRLSGWKCLVDVKKSEENGQIVLSWGNSEAVCTLKTMTSDHTKWMTFLEFSGLWVKKHWQHRVSGPEINFSELSGERLKRLPMRAQDTVDWRVTS